MSDIECSKWPRYADGVFHLAIQKPRRLAAGQLYKGEGSWNWKDSSSLNSFDYILTDLKTKAVFFQEVYKHCTPKFLQEIILSIR